MKSFKKPTAKDIKALDPGPSAALASRFKADYVAEDVNSPDTKYIEDLVADLGDEESNMADVSPAFFQVLGLRAQARADEQQEHNESILKNKYIRFFFLSVAAVGSAGLGALTVHWLL